MVFSFRLRTQEQNNGGWRERIVINNAVIINASRWVNLNYQMKVQSNDSGFQRRDET